MMKQQLLFCLMLIEGSMVAVAAGVSTFDHLLDLAEAVDGAGDGDDSRLAEPVLFRGLRQELREQRVAEVLHRNLEPLLLLPHLHRHPPLRRRRRLSLTLLLLRHDSIHFCYLSWYGMSSLWEGLGDIYTCRLSRG